MLRPGMIDADIRRFIDDICTNWRPEWGDRTAWAHELTWSYTADIDRMVDRLQDRYAQRRGRRPTRRGFCDSWA